MLDHPIYYLNFQFFSVLIFLDLVNDPLLDTTLYDTTLLSPHSCLATPFLGPSLVFPPSSAPEIQPFLFYLLLSLSPFTLSYSMSVCLSVCMFLCTHIHIYTHFPPQRSYPSPQCQVCTENVQMSSLVLLNVWPTRPGLQN